ncbi:nuclear factor NF-kappa-B p100 subunit [Hippocampus comes]|uniref:Nuclear factor of kappa light polypeptide gene enhancer in B-cells 2 (p49/p100) n=1 Tax=Hippocampus comes TaxID=109280 RepID=A0A3Q2YBX4_HIPCM|nr:PREDICTED: nuclear factor NF-kappa-B p100 subunit [Hippocampus comes]XP_019715668.1 PREDICTED: nuclear factor NF-kappa-B p100 subunit [Hippocampus comes]XP_019715669.1 PREDICTED: nuclear factor NF-kappa-B p100 subunit [Hippocampus comes]
MTEAQLINGYDSDFQFNLTPYEYIPPVDVKTEAYIPETAHGPYIQIIEEPKQRGFRFRYECEGPSHGGLPGASSEKNRRTYPTVKINNYVGHARVEVQLVTHMDPPRVHAHSLVGRHCNENGTCTLDVGPNDLTASFSNLGILHVTKKGVVEVLTRRLRDEWRRRRGGSAHLTAAEESALSKEAKELSKMVDLNIVRLKFTAFLKDSNGGFTRALKAVVSNPIYDSKSPNASNLKISRIDKTCGSVLGGDEIFLLCDKVQKDDIEIRFYEDEDGGWEAFGDFAPTDVHKQYAIVFKTPPYHTAELERPVTVFLQLKRKKAGDCSDPKHFTYIPHVQDKEEVLKKKQKPLPHYEPWRGGGERGGGAGGGFGGGGATGEGFHFSQHMNGAVGGAGGGGVFYSGNVGRFGGGGGAHMVGSAPQQRQLSIIAAAFQAGASGASRQARAALLRYCASGDARFLLRLHGRLCATRDAGGDTPLHLSIIHQQMAVTCELIDTLQSSGRGHVLDVANHLQQTALHLAVLMRQPCVVEALMRAGADPGLRDRDGRCPLHLAALGGDVATLRAALANLGERHAHLLTAADYHGLAPLHLAVRRDGHRCLRLLVESGAKVNAPELKGGHTALHMAINQNLLKVACTLVTELKADVNARTFGGNTPLHLAAAAHAHTLCSVLLAAGADKDAENDEPLVLSSSDDDDEDREEEEAGARVSSQPISCRKRRVGGHTALDLAKCHKVRKLLTSASARHVPNKIKDKADGERWHVDACTLRELVDALSDAGVPWNKLADKLGMMTLAHLYQDSPAPCHSLLQHYQLGGGPVEDVLEALESLGVHEGVRLLRRHHRPDAHAPPPDKLRQESTVDSGFSSQPIEDEQPPAANH